jgi:hypothetical protein
MYYVYVLLKMLYYEAHLSKANAEKRQRYFKTTKGKATIKQMLRWSLNNFKPKSEALLGGLRG